VIWVLYERDLSDAGPSQRLSAGKHSLVAVNGVISQVFPSFATNAAAPPVVFFAAAMAARVVLTVFYFPETKEASLEQLQRKLRLADV
jgi:MFS transporter, SP family, arabinose:H+ symporter